jgi:hypothetical protein
MPGVRCEASGRARSASRDDRGEAAEQSSESEDAAMSGLTRSATTRSATELQVRDHREHASGAGRRARRGGRTATELGRPVLGDHDVVAPAGLRSQLSPVTAPVHPSPYKGVFIYNEPMNNARTHSHLFIRNSDRRLCHTH